MSNAQPGSQGPPQQPHQQQAPQPQLLKAEDISKLRFLADDQRLKYRQALGGCWAIVNSGKPPNSPEVLAARQKLAEWSTRLISQEKAYRNKEQQQQQQQGQNANPQGQSATPQPGPAQLPPAPPSQPPKQQPMAQPQPQQGQPQSHAPQQGDNRPQGTPSHAQLPLQNQQNQQMQPRNFTENILKHVNGFPFRLPASFVPGSVEAQTKLKEMRESYTQALTRSQSAGAKISHMNQEITKRQQAGQEVPPELFAQRTTFQNQYEQAKRFVDDFRKRQEEFKAQGLPQVSQLPPQQPPNSSQPPPSAHQPPSQPQNLNAPQNMAKQEPTVKIEGGQQQQQPPTPQLHNQQMPPTSLSQPAPRPPPNPHAQPMPHPNQAAFVQQQQQQQQQQQHHQQQQQPNPHMQQRPQLNQQQPNPHMQQQSNSPHPQSATSTGPSGPPIPLTHHAAVTAAARSYSNPDAQRMNSPMAQGPGNFQSPASREREHMNNSKMPIPRTLNTTAPVPVNMGHARPTLSGPSNGAPGPMGQPVINKFPPFQLEGEGDRVLSKRKLDELVRQVTGGSEDALTPEVESAMLQLADEFVDTLITQACKLSKLRESPNLEIRDLQLVLERNYNIRIPGYSSDEVRTVRKLVPAPGWTQKMNLVQASKVMGGKND